MEGFVSRELIQKHTESGKSIDISQAVVDDTQ